MKEILKHFVETISLPEDSYLDQDAEILEIFIEELEEIFQELDQLIPQWLVQPNEHKLLVEVRRHFHTLKGSGRMVGAKSSSELAWTVEETLNRIIATTLLLNSDLQRYVQTAFNLYRFKFYDDFKNVQAHALDIRPLILLGQQLQQQQGVEPALEELLILAEQLNTSTVTTGLEIQEEQATDAESSVEFVPAIDADQNTEIVATDDGLIKETLAIFLEEAEEHLQTVDAFLQQDAPTDQSYNQLIRALHTLRGSSSMAHIQQVFDASSKVETLFKTLMQDELESTSNETALLTHYAEFVRDYLHTLHQQGSQQQLDKIDQKFNQAWENYGFNIEEIAHEAQHPQGVVTSLLQLEIENLLNADYEFEKRAKHEFPAYIQQLLHEAVSLIEHTPNRASQGVHDYLLQLRPAYEALLQKPALLHIDFAFDIFGQAHQQVIHLFDILAAGQRVSLGQEQQSILNELQDFVQQDIETTLAEIEEEAVSNPEQQIEPVEQIPASEPATSPFDLSQISARIRQDHQYIDAEQANRNFDADLLDIFLEEADELLVGIDADLNTWSQQQSNTSALNNLMRYLHTLKGGANMVQATHMGLIAHELETIYERLINGQIHSSANLIQIIRLVQDDIADRIQTLRDQAVDYPATEVLGLLQNIEQVLQGVPQQSEPAAITEIETDEIAFEDQILETQNKVFVEESATDVIESTFIAESALVDESESVVLDEQVLDSVSIVSNDENNEQQHSSNSDADVEEIVAYPQDSDLDDVQSLVEATFYEEAEELLETAHQLLQRWFDDRANRSVLLQLQRTVHSLKGGARMAELEPVAVIASHLENAFEQFGVKNFSSNAYDHLLLTAFTWLKQAIFERSYNNYDGLKHTLERLEFVDTNAQIPSKLARADLFSQEQVMEFVQGDGTEPPSMLGEWDNTVQVDDSNEMIRVSADLIEKMINLSGENAINRSRIEMDLGQLGNTLVEMELAIQRLADQLRRMEGELESQIIAKHGTENSRYTDFDPLEMDQYSSLNQLSKSLAESASDLVDFKTTLSDKIRDTEGLLLQQSRIQAEIQESLMRTRLVPFSRLLPRLQRIVRQTATTLNRPAELVVQNTEGELDRTILERLVTPLEHMLRNAVDHGLEDRDERLKLGKPETGRIELNISRQGTDVLVSFSDDGKGIEVEKIKAKALQNGLMTADQKLDAQEILQYIFHPGFSTATAVTQISGRGVGLDVVQSGIKALGGHVSVESKLGSGTTFTIRVPTTVAVSDALMVKVGDQQFALPLAQIDRIVRIAPSTLEQYFNGQDDYFNIDNTPYRLRYLAEFVANQPVPKLSGVAHSLPVLLVKGAHGQTIALLVDQLVGSRAQIVVKPIGQQFASIGTVAGATILGDGHVCLILDGQNIARQIQATQRNKQLIDGREKSRHTDERRLVMIVDDSVTVRKVTSRLLERQGFDVVTAKDGVDAMEQLENVKPDLMLLDIEMPRMDGFEVTNLVRHHELHQDMPIIMITSRTGEKHRERALSLGVSHYMGKPFQEAELLANIEDLLETRSGSY
ncbi:MULTISPECIES: Hpt domain-containing protein [unclassified Acinetobacter]|uniref:hybrid sensor histidine kinase/response regulator n=1 Tax=unclassified Acinetobacter TaxID=196816 RepID=UPI00190C8010|nr:MULTISPECIES: Hpt domain-containing protein [unclassified Acinetobacter]MBK0064374.1 Hpt domain-containing protein [Acinetobacter sp. S55]MBK0067821.1 Hpt domain-containing protein [Acinetobacter sp. S54]